ncbi:syntaxin-like protein [Mycena pura]|uniref:Syntaxin-like protein n=1 Tax=Mycena pura TaxID=153505 RepID=A0AAD6Y066_9AGAR|nr:syntaxin-like protein [Mycena pura]
MSSEANGTQSHELATLDTSDGASLDGMQAFRAEASAVQDALAAFGADVARVGALNNRALDTIGDESAAAKAELDALVDRTMARSTALKERIKRLQGAVMSGRGKQEREMRQNQIRTKFTEALQAYRQVEHDYRAKSRQRVERQYRIVEPNATQQEISEAITNGGGNQVFMQALTSSSDYANARSAYNEVQTRAQDIRKMEQTLAELAQLFSDIDVLVTQQNETLVAIEESAADVEANAEAGLKETSRAVKIARSLRKKRWICFFIVLIIVAILAIVLAVVFTKK